MSEHLCEDNIECLGTKGAWQVDMQHQSWTKGFRVLEMARCLHWGNALSKGCPPHCRNACFLIIATEIDFYLATTGKCRHSRLHPITLSPRMFSEDVEEGYSSFLIEMKEGNESIAISSCRLPANCNVYWGQNPWSICTFALLLLEDMTLLPSHQKQNKNNKPL